MTGPDAAAESAETTAAQNLPVIRVERGNPTPEEVAALVAVLSAASGGGTPAEPDHERTMWDTPRRALRLPPWPGRDRWRRQGWLRLSRS